MGEAGGGLRHKDVEGSGSPLELPPRTPTKRLFPDPLRKLHDFDSTSPLFHKQFVNFLRGQEYRNTVPDLQGEDLARLVEYLDSVSPQTTSPYSALKTDVGSHRHF